MSNLPSFPTLEQRLQSMPDFKFEFEEIGENHGIFLYKNTLPTADSIPARLEETLTGSEHAYFKWHESLVGEGTKMPEYRDCVDFKMDDDYIPNTPAEFSETCDIYKEVASAQWDCVDHYGKLFNVNMKYMEAINFVRYGSNQHFSVHTDHGFSYICTVSAITYINDDYEGGELWFPYLDLTIKPKAGDTIMFPSTYLFAHAALPVTSGIKYSAVTMFDYNEDAHQHGGFSRDFGQTNNQPYEPSISTPREATPDGIATYAESNTSYIDYVHGVDREEIRQIVVEEIHKYATESYKSWQASGQPNPYQQYAQ